MGAWVAVAPAQAFGPGERRLCEIDGVPVAVFNVDGDYLAIEDQCTHDGGSLADGPVSEGVIACPRHGARFCLRTGAALSAPAFEPTAALETRVHQGMVEVRDPRW